MNQLQLTSRSGKIGTALVSLIVFVVVFGAISVGTYFVFGVVEVKVWHGKSDFVVGSRPIAADNCTECKPSMVQESKLFQVSYLLYFISMLALFGGALFVLFGGIGLVTNPVDLFITWRNRPKPIDDTEFNLRRVMIGEVCDALIKEGMSYRSKHPRRQKYNKWRQETYLLEEEYERTVEAHKGNGIRILWYWLMFALSILGYVSIALDMLTI